MNEEITMRQLQVDYPERLPDILQISADQFEAEARMAMAVKLFEMGRISSGVGAELANVSRVQFLMELSKYKVSAINIQPDELSADVQF
jgi:predicted HTH domain antitoxin